MKRSELNTVVFAYILNAIDGEGYGKDLNTDKEKLQHLADCFKTEYVFPDNLKRYGSYQKMFENWIMGLPSSFNIDFYNFEIVKLAKKWECLPQNTTEDQEYKITSNWWNWISNKTFQLMKKHNVSPY